VTDECAEKQENCKATVDKIDCPTSEPQPLNFKFDGSAKALEDLDTADVEITAKLGPIQVLKKTVSACGQQSIDLPLGAGTIGLDLLKCPVKSGDEQQITGSVAATQALPGATKLTVTITATDKQQNKVVDLSVLVQGEKESDEVEPDVTNVWQKMAKVFGGSSASITVTDECAEKQENCKATVDKIDCPTSEPQPLNFKFDGSAKALEDLDTADVEITAKLGPIQVLKKTVSACGQQSIDLPLGAGTIGLDLLKCPVKSGDEQQITGSVAATQALPGGTKLTVTITATDKQQNKVVDLSVLVQGEKEDEKHVVPETNIWVKLGQVYGDATIQKEESNAAQTFIV